MFPNENIPPSSRRTTPQLLLPSPLFTVFPIGHHCPPDWAAGRMLLIIERRSWGWLFSYPRLTKSTCKKEEKCALSSHCTSRGSSASRASHVLFSNIYLPRFRYYRTRARQCFREETGHKYPRQGQRQKRRGHRQQTLKDSLLTHTMGLIDSFALLSIPNLHRLNRLDIEKEVVQRSAPKVP